MAHATAQNVQGQYSTLPEVNVPEPLLEPVFYQDPQAQYPQCVSSDGKEAYLATVVATAENHPKPWWKRPKIIIIISVSALVVLGVVVGAVTGVLVSRRQSSSGDEGSLGGPSGPTPSEASTPSACRGTMCPAMIAIVPDSSPSAPANSKLFFVLHTDKAIWTRRGDGSKWETEWTSLNGSFSSQPAAVTFMDGQTNVFAVDARSSLLAKALKKGVWDKQWLNLEGLTTTPPSVCSSSNGAFDIWGRATGNNLYHMNWNSSNNPGYTNWTDEGGYLSSAPIASCAGDGRVDVVLYGGYQAPFDMFVKRWHSATFKTDDFFSAGGNFIGDPTAVSLGTDRTDYFGIGVNKDMFHMSWTRAAGYGPLGSIGGSFESAPYAIAVGADRIDVLAVGTDDRLKHNALIGSSWGLEWEDLGGSFSSAPAAFSTSTGKVVVFGLASNGSMFHGSWSIGSAYTWTNASGWMSDGGDFSTKWFRQALS